MTHHSPADRDAEIVRRYLAGEHVDAIGAAMGISGGRVRQIVGQQGAHRTQTRWGRYGEATQLAPIPVLDLRVRERSGDTYGLLTVIKRVPSAGRRPGAWWLCQCRCGGWKEVAGVLLEAGDTRSCGCLRREAARRNGRLARVAGGAG